MRNVLQLCAVTSRHTLTTAHSQPGAQYMISTYTTAHAIPRFTTNCKLAHIALGWLDIQTDLRAHSHYSGIFRSPKRFPQTRSAVPVPMPIAYSNHIYMHMQARCREEIELCTCTCAWSRTCTCTIFYILKWNFMKADRRHVIPDSASTHAQAPCIGALVHVSLT